MAKQLNLLSKGQVIPTALHTEMQRSYLEYAMSVIVGRALPDVRDGLKPVHRRILYAMHELGLTPDRPYRKCARVVGDVLGKYHPHGDQAVYDALVRLVQDFSSRYPLLAGHGNFGSVDNDPPAAMRYTETRLAPISHEALLAEIGEETIEFISNFDNSQQEPVVLPAQLPLLLLNGCTGIAVGMATNIPPHNLGELVDGLIALIDQPELTDEKLFELIPGPDFPTGGEIIGTAGIREAYSTGRGSMTLRGVAQVEEVPGGRGSKRRTAIVITELPFQVNKAGWIEKVAELVNQGRLEGIADIRDESDRTGMRVVIELKRDNNPQDVLQHLYHQTALQMNFGAILLAIVDGQPRQLSLRQLLQEFLKFREETLNRRYTHQLHQAESRVHIVSGLLRALSQLDDVIAILRQASDGSSAKITLQSRFDLTEAQADAILSMPLRRLTSLEQENLKKEFASLNAQIQELQKLLNDRRELLKALKKDLRSLKRKFSDVRRTKLAQNLQPIENKKTGEKQKSPLKPQALPLNVHPVEEVVLEFTQRGYVKRSANGQRASRKSKGENGNSEYDCVIQTQAAKSDQTLLVLTSSGKVYPVQVGEIPASGRGEKRGNPLIGLLPNSAAAETVVSQFLLPEDPETTQLVLLTKLGRIKRLAMTEFLSITNRGLTVIKFKDDDELLSVLVVQPDQNLVLATIGGRLLRFPVNDEQLPIMGRTAVGLQALRLRKQEKLVGGVALDNLGDNVLLVSQSGAAKRVSASTLRQGNRGDIGTQAMQFMSKSDALAGMVLATDEAALVTNMQRVVRMSIDQVMVRGKDGAGNRIAELNPGEKVIEVVAIE
ncbi:DNA gyrase subunit A [Gloeocapsopsis dulcis]|uniref:DNA topoisomerase (ATP-hydrolyzing) n=1 Tax=Gloeocapsopsis dulcis AAB1 = 1H9 TaxID=1433147 RepID=A0A6N8FTD6_9CHRO|nr:DNA gyrase subunit A [Gloeocapsopsis dulcis]MUL36014.1 DNA topoisomerase IV [Gloeocapsopsis dulcis AAB1 = 1H9]WNN88267.1 DNA gyrase subunit A [Gloeocapsopsis dulcis]